MRGQIREDGMPQNVMYTERSAHRTAKISISRLYCRLRELLRLFSNNLSTSRLEREILRLWYGARAIGVGCSRRNGYGNAWYESKHVETSEVYPVSLPAAGDATELAVRAEELSIARTPEANARQA